MTDAAGFPSLVRIRAEARDAWCRLGAAIDTAEQLGLIVPCQRDPGGFTADLPGPRRKAAEACLDACPALQECAAFADANREEWHVWAGVDRVSRREQCDTPTLMRGTNHG